VEREEKEEKEKNLLGNYVLSEDFLSAISFCGGCLQSSLLLVSQRMWVYFSAVVMEIDNMFHFKIRLFR